MYYDNYVVYVLGIGDWGLGIGPNPQSPIPKVIEITLSVKVISYFI